MTKRIDNFLNSESVINSYTVTYKGKAFSLNHLYQGGNSVGAWSVRKKIKDKYIRIFKDLLEEAEETQGLKEFDKFYLGILYNSRHDVDNVIGMGKVFADALKTKYVKEDNKKHYKGIMIFADGELEQNQFDFIIMEISDGEN